MRRRAVPPPVAVKVFRQPTAEFSRARGRFFPRHPLDLRSNELVAAFKPQHRARIILAGCQRQAQGFIEGAVAVRLAAVEKLLDRPADRRGVGRWHRFAMRQVCANALQSAHGSEGTHSPPATPAAGALDEPDRFRAQRICGFINDRRVAMIEAARFARLDPGVEFGQRAARQ